MLVRAARRTMNYNQIYSSHSCVSLEVHTTLNDVCTKNRRDDGCDDLKDLLNSIPFNHKVIFLKLYNIFAGVNPAILHQPQPLLHKKGLQPVPQTPMPSPGQGLKQIIAARRRLFLCFGIAGRRDVLLMAAQ